MAYLVEINQSVDSYKVSMCLINIFVDPACINCNALNCQLTQLQSVLGIQSTLVISPNYVLDQWPYSRLELKFKSGIALVET